VADGVDIVRVTEGRRDRIMKRKAFRPLREFLAWLVLPSCAIFLSGCNSILKHQLTQARNAEAARLIGSHLDFYERKVHIGMSREGALAYFPKPQNTNTQNVCIWVYDSTETVKSRDLDWQSLQATRAGYFVVFVDGKLATPICADSSFNSWGALKKYGNFSQEQANQVLGPE
jgi:hypothetical protein